MRSSFNMRPYRFVQIGFGVLPITRYQLHHILEVTLSVYGTKRYSGNRAFNCMLAGSISRCNVSFDPGYSCHLPVFGEFLRTYSRHRISNSDPFREQGTNAHWL